MTGPAILVILITTLHGTLPPIGNLVERRECPALAAAVHVNTGPAYRGWTARAACRDAVVLPPPADGRGR